MKKVLALILALLLACALLACTANTDTPADSASPADTAADSKDAAQPAETVTEDTHRTIGLVLLNGAIEHCQHFDEGVRSVAEANGDEVITLDGAYSVETINKCIEDLVSREVDAIIVDALDKEGHISSIKIANAAGIPVVQSDNLCADESVVIGMTASDNYDAGYQCGLDAAAKMEARGEQGKAICLENPGAPAPEARLAGFLQACEDKGIEVLAVQPGAGVEAAAATTENLIQAYPEANICFCIDDPAAMGAYSSLKTAGMIPDCLVYGVDGNMENKELIASGEIAGTVQQDPFLMGATSCEFFYHYWAGEEYDFNITLPITFINSDNVADYM